MGSSDDFNLGKSLGYELVTIIVGKEKRKFAVHKQLICESVAYFRGAFSVGGFKESQDCSMDIPEDEPGVFEYFMHWLYRGTLLGVYIFAEKLCVNELANKAINAIQAISKSDDFDQLPDCIVEHADKIWKSTSPTFPLRKWYIHALVYDAWDFEASIDKKKKAFMLDMAELVILWELFKDHRDLYVSLFTPVQKHSADDPPECQFEEDKWDDCYFHRHSEGEVCHLTTSEVKQNEDSEDEIES
ncbi:uncharacterized protein Bfra_000139 [Botrytis fragariae]|uniref:BTB domain-containing protein n=1 Tax=Botrytis fragariae TaxID=1964551 RepID=A0A8H6B244_9HELO|nr:uncharacterized protein Bfra_000139 [Botrytis fragariae]KAF5877974.1 hypothetical protein Bfra_000139 [Botrytis fragariae]